MLVPKPQSKLLFVRAFWKGWFFRWFFIRFYESIHQKWIGLAEQVDLNYSGNSQRIPVA